MGFARLLKLKKSKIEKLAKAMTLDEISLTIREGVKLFPKMAKAMEEESGDYRPTAEEWRYAMIVGSLLSEAKSRFDS